VRTVILQAAAPPTASNSALSPGAANNRAKSSAPSVIRLRGGDLWYSDTEQRAIMRAGVLDAVVAETGSATSSSNRVELRMLPAPNREVATGSQAQVDRMSATGHVVLTSLARRATGEQLDYSSVTGDYVLAGTPAAPPKMTDPQKGTVTGQALIFHSRDDSVSIEGGDRASRTETTAPEAHAR